MPKRPEAEIEVDPWESWAEPQNRRERRALQSLLPRERMLTVSAVSPAPSKKAIGTRKPAAKSKSIPATASRSQPAQKSQSSANGRGTLVSDVPTPAPLQTPEPVVHWATEICSASLAQTAVGSLDSVVRALWACELASAAKFDDLLCLSTLQSVVLHGYQLDTVRKVMRLFRGRALLADEVGLGKTIEARMVLREYQLRRLVRRALILVPPSLVGHWQAELSSKCGVAARIAGKREGS